MAKSSSHSASDPTAQLVEKLTAALAFQKNSNMEEAEKIYKDIVRQYPNNPDALQMAAIFYNQTAKYPYALTLLKKVISTRPNDLIVNKAMGKALYETGKYPEAKTHLEKALTQNLDDPEANALLGLCLHKMNNFKGAENFYRRSLKHRPSVEITNRLAELLLFDHREKEAVEVLKEMLDKEQGDYDSLISYAVACAKNGPEAIKAIRLALKAEPDREEAKTMLGLILASGSMFNHTDPALAELTSVCLASKYVDHNELHALWHNQFFASAKNAKAETLLDKTDYDEFKIAFEQEEYRRTLLKPFFIVGVAKIIVFNARIENLYTFARRYYLELFSSKERALERYEIDFLKALAIQSFFNEFIFDETSAEVEKINLLQNKLESATNIKDVKEDAILFACYRPLTHLKNADALFSNDVTDDLKDIVEMHINEPRAEQKIKKSMPVLGKIADDVSRKVQAQYEENPYPRWQSANFLRSFFTKFVSDSYKGRDKILVAGCGTGKHILSLYNIYAYMEATVIDLSSSSLAYAIRKSKEYGLKEVKFFHGDLLDAGRLKEKFNFIECVGVLHHMQDPAKGLRALVDLLAPHGEVRLGLYSEYARQDVVKIRQIIAEKGFEPTLEGIRACRAYIKESPESEFAFIRRSLDFFSASTCRDLMFHVQEIRYTIPQLKELLDSAGLEFTEFALQPQDLSKFKSLYPENSDSYNLDAWDDFERKNPAFFGAMYQFRAKRK